ncbi:MAG: hypothetical protein CO161_03285 [Candidatus Portnoybacteria bacterium CG_4_9_14_3_um_filter_44_9]|uniref:Uncharacterized protein n=1 Tax=Candidatus Portnoybacteria bacterium CG_4_9_14_3_um_filter_44_9 TaxID=1974806 RepID=A0A2M7YJ80_9BACT|nr:MAG: hypothetical protein CO161_03285 [Candidatus Portnoybacteria bacterium CG_4_9_14_3_um_filter_44_9]
MKKEKLTCKTELKKNIIKKAVFGREIKLCRQLAKENKGKCEWGKCNNCGVVPLLWKLYKGELLEGGKIIKTRDKILRLK